jgi:hypothetical protein
VNLYVTNKNTQHKIHSFSLERFFVVVSLREEEKYPNLRNENKSWITRKVFKVFVCIKENFGSSTRERNINQSDSDSSEKGNLNGNVNHCRQRRKRKSQSVIKMRVDIWRCRLALKVEKLRQQRRRRK